MLALAACGKSEKLTTTAADLGWPAAAEPNDFVVRSESMAPTLRLGAHVAVEPTNRPRVGEVVVFHPPDGAEKELCGPNVHVTEPGGAACDAPLPENTRLTLIKRIVAGPGAEVEVKNGRLLTRQPAAETFAAQYESYAASCGVSFECNFPVAIKIPAGEWFLMGDNRGDSDDSRFFGPVPTGWIVGIVRP